MKTIFTKFVICCSVFASQLSNAQAPILPLFENNSIKWGSNLYYKSSDRRNDVITRHELAGDTIIESKSYRILLSSNKLCFQNSNCVFYYGKKFLSQEENLIIEVDLNGKLIDTVLYMQSTIVNSKVRFNRSNFSIVSIDSIDFNNVKIRRFNFENSFGYLDGIGFDNNGPYATGSTYAIGEGSSYLNCFERDGLSYSMERDGKISSVNLSTTACENPLNVEVNNINNYPTIFINQNNQLETSQIASSIEIFNSKGQKLLQNKDASLTDISSLSNGFYIANIMFSNKLVKHNFLVNN